MAEMSNASSNRADIDGTRRPTCMSEYQERSVLYQDAVARWAGSAAPTFECVSLFVSEGQQRRESSRSATRLTAGGAITAVIIDRPRVRRASCAANRMPATAAA